MKAAQLYFFIFMVNIMECPDTEIGLGPAALSATLHPTRDFYPKELALSQAHQTGRTVQPELKWPSTFLSFRQHS